MKAIIEGKRYDTETAEKLCDISPLGYPPGHFYWEETALYVTRRGAFFLAGKGGAYSRWARPFGANGASGGSGLRPVGREEAQEVLERYGTPEEVERLFPVEDA